MTGYLLAAVTVLATFGMTAIGDMVSEEVRDRLDEPGDAAGHGRAGAVRPRRAVRAQAAAVERGRGRAASRGRADGVMTATPGEPGERIARARRRRGLSQAVLAGLVGRSESWLSQVERGRRGVDSHAVLTRMAAVLRVDVAELTGPAWSASPRRGRSSVTSRGHGMCGLARLAAGGPPAGTAIAGGEITHRR